MIRHPRRPPLFPSTPLSRSSRTLLQSQFYEELESGYEDLLRRIGAEFKTLSPDGPGSEARPEALPAPPAGEAGPAQRAGVFISYSHLDKKWLAELQKMLKPLVRNGVVNL